MSDATSDTPPVKSPPPEKRKAYPKVVTFVTSKEELVASTPNVRNWRGMLIALLVIVAVLGLILFSIFLLSPPDQGPRVQGSKFTIDHITGGHFKSSPFNGSWVSETEVVYRDKHGGLSLHNVLNNSYKVLMTNSTFRQLNAAHFRVSNDLKFVLLISDIQQMYTNTYEARYHIYEVATQNRSPLTPVPTSVDDNEAPLLQLVVWAPRGNGLAFVYENDLYYRPKAKGQVYQLTKTGSDVVSNGLPDWMYQEEILKDGSAVWFAPDGKALVYATFNDTMVGQIRYPYFGGPKDLYPSVHSIRYPKPGTANPEVSLWMVNVTQPKALNATQLTPTPVLLSDSQTPYLIAVSWAEDRHVAVVWMNRRQNLSSIVVCSSPTWRCQDSYVQKSSRWVEPSTVLFSDDHRTYLTLLPVLDGDAGHFMHVCHVDRDTHQVTPLTHGQLTVTRLLVWDNDNHVVYFEAAPERRPSQRHIYRVSDIVNITTPVQWECLSCPLYATNNTNATTYSNQSNDQYPVKSSSCLFIRATFAPGVNPRFYILECLGPDTPTVQIMNAQTNSKVMTLDANSVLADKYASMARPQIKIFQVEMESSYNAQVRLMLPPGFREDEEMSFPLILKVGTPPGGQSVSEQWFVDWSTYLVSQRNFIVAEIDVRGSGFQGERIKHEVFRRMGQADVHDQISVITYLRDHLTFIDKTKMGVWGKGYGGFAAATIMSQTTDLFHCGIALAPITSWTQYYSAFTERIMGTPNVTDNYLGYEVSDLSKHAGNLRDKPFLLIHGSADDTVHFQHSMILVHAFTEEGVMFRHQTYPDEGHNFEGVQEHLYRAMEAFWDECFGPTDFIEWETGSSIFSFRQ